MASPMSPIKHARIGTCPHGLPMGACPICSGSGGGGGGAKKAAPTASEMSWDECFAVGQMMKAQRLNQQQLNNQALQPQISLPITFQGNLANFAQNITNIIPKITEFTQKLQDSMPKIIAKPIEIIANKVLIPMLNTIKDVAVVLQKTVAQLGQKLVDIEDKLTAVFGELKNNIEKKISDKFNDFKKKAKKFFAIFEPKEIDEEENKLEEEKRIFDLKTLLNSIKENLTKKEYELNGEN